MVCSKCGEEMRMTEKDTSSGRDIREYLCDGCGHSDWEVRGPALWQILHDDREEFMAAEAKRNSANGTQPKIAEPENDQSRSLWSRLLAWFARG